jgi:hypothetical protein
MNDDVLSAGRASVECDGEPAQRLATLPHAVQDAVRQPSGRLVAQSVILGRQLHDHLAKLLIFGAQP